MFDAFARLKTYRAIHTASVVTILVATSMAACSEDPAPPPVPRTAFLADVTLSTEGDVLQNICLQAFRRVVGYAAAGRGTASVELITGNPRRDSRTPIDVRFRVPEQFEGNPVYAGPILQRLQDGAVEQLENGYEQRPTSRGTDVLSAIELAERILSRPTLGPEPELKLLIVCSDMMNSVRPYNFYSSPLSEADITSNISRLREEGRLPDLSGVRVYVVGAGQPTRGHLSADRIRAVEAFFLEYFQATGAEVVSYAATLPPLT